MCLPEPELAKRYLNDFFKHYNRFAYQTQMTFLCSKAVHIIELLQSNNSVILDRSLYEDVNIFANVGMTEEIWMIEIIACIPNWLTFFLIRSLVR